MSRTAIASGCCGRIRRQARTDKPARRFRRGVYLLPSMFTLANMFSGYACIVYAMRGELEKAAPLIGLAIVVDMLDGRVARMTGTHEPVRRRIRLARGRDLVRRRAGDHGVSVGPASARPPRLGRRLRLRRGRGDSPRPVQHSDGDGGQEVLRRPAESGGGRRCRRRRSSFIPKGSSRRWRALAVLAMVIVPGLLMVSTIRFYSFKTLDLQSRRAYPVLALLALGLRAADGARNHARGDRVRLPDVGPRDVGVVARAPAQSRRRRGRRTKVRRPTAKLSKASVDRTVGRDLDRRPRSRLARRSQSSRRSTPRCAWRSAVPVRFRSLSSKSRARRRARAQSASIPAPVSDDRMPDDATASARATMVSVPRDPIACRAFSMMLVSARVISVRSMCTGGRIGGTSTSK